MGSVAVVEAGTFYEISNRKISQIPTTNAIFAGKDTDDWQPQIDWGYQTIPQSVSKPSRYGNHNACFTDTHDREHTTLLSTMLVVRPSVAVPQEASWSTNVVPSNPCKSGPTKLEMIPMNGTTLFNTPKSLSTSVYQTWAFHFPTLLQTLLLLTPPSFQLQVHFQSPGFTTPKLSVPVPSRVLNKSVCQLSQVSWVLLWSDLRMWPSLWMLRVFFSTATRRQLTSSSRLVVGYPSTLTANKEAILSAGVFGSPQLLMVSGVGTAEELSALGIDVIADRPTIGKGMQDHDIISHRSKDSPPAPILGYPRVEDNSSDYETFTGQQLDSFVNSACKYFIENGLKPVGWSPRNSYQLNWLLY